MKIRNAFQPGFFMVGLGVLFLIAVATTFIVRNPGQVPTDARWVTFEADPQQGRVAIMEYGCGSCHEIPGIREADGRVGPRLDRLTEQSYIAGVLANTPENLVVWIQDPRDVNPLTAMPDLGVSEDEARNIAAYLYSREQ